MPVTVSKLQLRAARILTGLPVAFLLFDAAIKVLKLAPAVQGTVQLGYPAGAVVGIGIVELVCVAIYLIPRTSLIGAILLTGYLGGAIASHVRIGDPLFSHILMPTYVAALLWGGLYLRDDRLRALVPVRALA
jgi:DoxX-like family